MGEQICVLVALSLRPMSPKLVTRSQGHKVTRSQGHKVTNKNFGNIAGTRSTGGVEFVNDSPKLKYVMRSFVDSANIPHENT